MRDIKFRRSDDEWSDLGLRGPWTDRQKLILGIIALVYFAIVVFAGVTALL
jgi:hypothetical protein